MDLVALCVPPLLLLFEVVGNIISSTFVVDVICGLLVI